MTFSTLGIKVGHKSLVRNRETGTQTKPDILFDLFTQKRLLPPAGGGLEVGVGSTAG